MKKILGTFAIVMFMLGMAIVSSGADLSAQTRALTSIEGTVTDSVTGEPLVGAYVYGWSSKGTMEYAETDVEGHYFFELNLGGTYVVQASMEGYEDDYEEVDVTIGDNEIVDLELIPLQLNCTVYGVMYDKETSEPQEGWVGLLEIESDKQFWVRVLEDGSFLFEVEAGYYKLNAHINSQYERYEGQVFELEDGDEKEINIPMVRLAQGVYGTVKDGDGQPLEGIRVSLENDEWRVGTGTDENGYYDIRAPPGAYELQISGNGYRPYSAEVEIEEEELLKHDAQLEETVIISFIVKLIRAIKNIIDIY